MPHPLDRFTRVNEASGEDGRGAHGENRCAPRRKSAGAYETEKGERMLLAETTFLDVLWYSILFFFWILAIWIFIMIVSDVFRRDDLSGGKKALWIVFMVILPFVGVLTYIIVRPKVTAQDVRLATQAEAAQRAVAGVSTADELAKLSELRTQGVLNEQEYEELKRKALAGT
jgi:phospholipase D-like protein